MNENIEEAHECEHINPNSIATGTTFDDDPICTVKVFKWKEWPNWCIEVDNIGSDGDTIELDIVFCPMCGERLQDKLVTV